MGEGWWQEDLGSNAPTQAWGHLPLQAKQFWPASNHFLLQGLVFWTEGGVERISSSTPGVHDSAAAASHLRSQRTWLPNSVLSPQLVLEGKKSWLQPASGMLQLSNWETYWWWRAKCPIFKTSLNPGCLIVAGYSTALSPHQFHPSSERAWPGWPHKQGAEKAN